MSVLHSMFESDHLLSSLQDLSRLQIIGIVTAAYLVYLLIRYRDHAIGTNKRSDLLSPRSWPLIGNMPFMLRVQGRFYENMLHMRREMAINNKPETLAGKTLTVTNPYQRLIFLTKPSQVEYVQKTNFKNFVKGGLFERCMSDVLGGGIFVVDGDHWFLQRKTTSHTFNVHTFRGTISSSIHEHLSVLHSLLLHHSESGEPLDMASVFFRFTLDSFVKMGFGQNLNSLSPTSPQPTVPFAEAFDFAQRRMSTRFFNPFASLSEGISIPLINLRLRTGLGREMDEARKIMFGFCERVIGERRRKEAAAAAAGAEDEKKEGEKDLLSLYMDIRDEKGEKLSNEQLKEIILNLIIAGRDTTAQALAWCFFHLIKHPRLMEPIRQEADKELGPNGEVNYDNYKLLKQANAVLHEALRLHPSVPMNAKTALAPDQIPDGGPRIEKGDIVRFSDWEMARDPTIWGNDCLEFKPSRWLDSKGELVRETQWKFHAFNGGPRLCLGQNLAIFEAVAVIVLIVRSFDLTFAPGWYESVRKTEGVADGLVEDGVPLYEQSLTLPMKSPLLVKVARRQV